MQLENTIQSALIRNAGKMNIVGELCKLELNIREGRDITQNILYLRTCAHMPGVDNVLDAVNILN